MDDIDVVEFGEKLRSEGFFLDVVEKFEDAKIDANLFVEMTEGDFKELELPLAQRIRLRVLQQALRKEKDVQLPGQNRVQQVHDENCVPTEVLHPPVSSSQPVPSSGDKPFEAFPEKHSSRDSTICEPLAVVSQPSTVKHPSSVSEKRFAAVKRTPTDPGWAHKLEIPTCFSIRTMEQVTSGIMTKAARREIVQALSTVMMNHTMYPSTADCEVIGVRLIKQFKGLKDGCGSGYDSWVVSLKDRFKNLRRGIQLTQQPLESDDGAAPKKAKRPKLYMRLDDGPTLDTTVVDDDAYKHHMKKLEQELTKQKKNTGAIKSLMQSTYHHRRQWIVSQSPPVKEILAAFPALKTSLQLRREFRAISDSSETMRSRMESWPSWREKVIKYAKLEEKHRKKLQELLSELDSCREGSENEQDLRNAVCLQILAALFQGKGSKVKLLHLIKEDEDLEATAASIPQCEPYILAVGNSVQDLLQFAVVAERQIVTEPASMLGAMLYLISTYFAFHINYPTNNYAIFIFLQHFVLDLKDRQKVPQAVVTVISTLNQM